MSKQRPTANNNPNIPASTCGTNGALLELLADIYSSRTRATDLGGTLFESGAGSTSPKRDTHHHADPHGGGGTGRGNNASRRATTALQNRIALTIFKSSDKEMRLASRRWLSAVFRAQCVWIDDHPTTPTRRGFVASPHDFFDMNLLSAPSDLQVIPPSAKYPSSSPTTTTASASQANQNTNKDNNTNPQTAPTAASQNPSPNRTNHGASPSPQRPSAANNNNNNTNNTNKNYAATDNLSTSIKNPVNPGDLLKKFMIRPQDVSSCLWYEGGLKLRAVLDRPVESLSRELTFRSLVNEEILNHTSNKNSPENQQQYRSISTMGGVGEYFEGLVLEYVQDEAGVWSRVSPTPLHVDPDGSVSSGGECHGFNLESVAPSWHCENRYMASQFAEPNSLMVSRTQTEVVVALPWGEKERIYGMLFLPPHVDDRYARLLAWDIFVSARVAFGSAEMCLPTQKEVKDLIRASGKPGFDDQTPSKEIVKVLGNLRAKVIPEAVQTIMALRRRYSPCPILPLSLTPLSPARSDVAVERIVLEICAFVFRAIGAADFAIFHDHRVLYTNVSLAVTGIMQNVQHLLRTQALDSGEFNSNLPSWSGSNDLDHVNDGCTLVAPVAWPPGQCLTQLCVEGTPQKAELPHRFCSLWTVGHNSFASSSIEVIFVLPPTPPPSPASTTTTMNQDSSSTPQQQPQQQHHAASFYEFAWSKKEPTLSWEIHDTLYPLFVLTERLNDAVLFCQKRAYATTGAGDGNNINGGGSVGLPVSLSNDGTTTNVNANRNVTFEIHKLGYAQTFTSTARGLGSGGHQLQPFQIQHQMKQQGGGGNNNNNASNNASPTSTTTRGNNGTGFANRANNQNTMLNSNNNYNTIGSASNFGSSSHFPNVAAGGGGATGVGGPMANTASALQPPAFVLNDNVDPDCYELDRVTRLAASFALSNLRPTKELWCSGGSSYSGLFSSDAQMKQEPCVRLRPAAASGVVLTTVAGADATQFTLSENRNTYCFPLM